LDNVSLSGDLRTSAGGDSVTVSKKLVFVGDGVRARVEEAIWADTRVLLNLLGPTIALRGRGNRRAGLVGLISARGSGAGVTEDFSG